MVIVNMYVIYGGKEFKACLDGTVLSQCHYICILKHTQKRKRKKHTHTPTHTHTHIYIYIYIYMCVCVRVCVFVCLAVQKVIFHYNHI